MKVAIDVSAIPPQLTGAGVYVANVVDALARRGDIPLALVTRRDDGERWQTLAPDAEVHTAVPGSRPVRLAWEQVAGPRTASAIGATLWHGPHYTMPVRASVPIVVTIHDLTFFDTPEYHERSKVMVFRRMIRYAARHADTVVCVSDRTARRLQELVEVRARVEVVPHAVDHARFRADNDASADDAALATLKVRKPYLVHLGTIEPRKNIPGLIRAFARVRATHPELRLVLAGVRGWGIDDVNRAVVDEGVVDAVDRLGYVDDAALPALLRGAAAVAYPAFEEGFGLPVLEGLACGALVVTSADTVMADVSAGAALLAPPGDDDALTAALLDALEGDHHDLRAAGPRVAAAYTWDNAAAAHAALYRSLST